MWLFAAITTSVSIMDGSLCLCAVLPLHPPPQIMSWNYSCGAIPNIKYINNSNYPATKLQQVTQEASCFLPKLIYQEIIRFNIAPFLDRPLSCQSQFCGQKRKLIDWPFDNVNLIPSPLYMDPDSI